MTALDLSTRRTQVVCTLCQQTVEFVQVQNPSGAYWPSDIPDPYICGGCNTPPDDPKMGQWVAPRRGRLTLAVPPLYQGANLDTFALWGTTEEQDRQRQMVRLMTRYVKKFPAVPPLMLFMGPPGTGKGHILWSVGKALDAQGRNVMVTKLSAMIRYLRGAWKKGDEGPSEETRLKQYRQPHLLVIDEVSRHAFYGEQVSQHLYDILDDRMDHERPTILTTNEADTGINQILGPALVDRLQGGGGVVDFTWRSYRQYGKDERKRNE